jgi:outer membrane protein OmpA-like peptidoglycan-associated protein
VSKYFLSLLLIFFTANAASQGILNSASLFSHKTKQQISYDAISGAIEYVIDENGDEGYKLTQRFTTDGRFDRKIYDYAASNSAQQLFELFSNEYKKQGYKTVYSCAQNSCGEVLGWKLYLEPLIEGSEQYQYYFLMERMDSSQEKSLVAVYINEFSNQPRVIFDRIGGIKVPPIHIVSFDKDSFKISDEQKRLLDSVKPLLQQENGKIDIIGFSDDLGSDHYNLGLSNQRAVAVMEYLTQSSEISSSALNIIAMGEVRAIQNHATEDYRKLNRRVELRQSKGR